MKLTIFNGSPKPAANNTEVLLQAFIDGFAETKGNEVELIRMNSEQSYKAAVSHFEKADVILLAFPLYVYAMPAGVKSFIEGLEPMLGRCQSKKLGFIVQYGFHEACHARPLEKYLTALTKDLGATYLGMIIKGGCDNLSREREMKNGPVQKKLRGAYEIGKYFGAKKQFDQKMLDHYAKPETQSFFKRMIMPIALRIINKIYWEASLKKNGVSYQDSFKKPYGS